ncbi:hypothetical protein BLA29_012448, partial [Euroglyphus maynei]
LDQLEARVREQHELVAQQQQQSGRRSRTNSTGEEASYEQQVDFLNSVIVDMQKKNDELRNRVQVLEEIGKFLREFENSFQTQVETTRTRTSNNGLTNGHIRTIRKYCDICELFDSHETEDCPQQSSSPLIMVNGIGQEPGHTYNAVNRTEHRSYCMTCEKFGH